MRFFITLLLLLAYFNSFAQLSKEDESLLDFYNQPTDFFDETLYNNIHNLATQITEKRLSKKENVIRIYKWLVINIPYDYELRMSTSLQKEIYTSEENVLRQVLKRNKALCGGVSFLFERMCHTIGIQAKTIHGFTDTAVKFDKPNHSWNAVKFDNKWHLLDITWSQDDTNLSSPDYNWLFTNPEKFIKTHYPLQEKWILMKYKPTLEEFASRN